MNEDEKGKNENGNKVVGNNILFPTAAQESYNKPIIEQKASVSSLFICCFFFKVKVNNCFKL